MQARKGVKIEELEQGTGPEAVKGKTVEIRCDGYLNHGDKFYDNVPSRFKIGGRDVIAGLEYGVEGMRVGGRRKIRISPHLAYGAHGVPGIIPANALLTFEVELLTVEDEAQ